MLNEILKWGFNAYVTIAIKIFDFIITPMFGILRGVIPEFNSYFVMINNFINNYIIKGIKFAKMAIVNSLGINHDLFTMFVFIAFMCIYIWFTTRILKLVLNIYSLYKSGNINFKKR